jgi:pyruvate dehydrogenase E2 component (dihydrolipoamide acetyltransferase)
MATEITMPQMGFDMTEGTIASWLKKEGETVTKGEPIAEIETDKTTIQIEAFGSGVLMRILAPAGAKIPVGDTIGIIADPGEKVDAAAAAPAPAAASAPMSAPSTPAAPAPAPAPAPMSAPSTPAAPAQDAPAQPEVTVATGVVAPAGDGRVIATPVARRIAEERGIDLRLITGTGPDGRITKADVESFVAPAAPAAPAAVPEPIAIPRPIGAPVLREVAPAAAGAQPRPIGAPVLKDQPAGGRRPLSRMRQTIAQRMSQAKTTVPHYYVSMLAEMDAALALRTQINESLKPEGVKVSVNDMVVRATALALRRFPSFNATFAGDAIELREAVHIGVALAVDGGLLTITVRDADQKTLKQIGAEVPAIAGRVREGKGQPGDLGGQTFTTSNLGMYGVDEVIPIVNLPDAAILGIGVAAPQAVVRDGEIVVRTIMKLTLAGDHRVTDGAEGAQFLAEIKRLLENPWSLVL